MSTATAIILVSASVVSRESSLVLICLGTFGGVFPDIDSDHSTSIKLVFHTLSIAIAFAVLFMLLGSATILVALLSWFGVYLFVFYLIQPIFKQFTVHRGVFHSTPMAILVCLATASFFYYIVGYSSKDAWFAGLFFCFGCMVHLLLDEFYSVDFANVDIKRSSGTAIKFYSGSFMVPFLVVYFLIATFLFFTPRYDTLKDEIFTQQNYQQIETHFLPTRQDNVFKEIWPRIVNNFKRQEEAIVNNHQLIVSN